MRRFFLTFGKRKLFGFVSVLLFVLLFSSCELGFDSEKPHIYVLSYGNMYPSVSINEYMDYGDSEFHQYSGISGNISSLNSTANDAEDVANAFDMLSKKAGYSCTTETILVRTSSQRTDGRYANFREKLDEIASVITEKDVFVFYYSGHGGNSAVDVPGLAKSYLVFSNQLVDYDLVRENINELKCTKLIICDACFSGAFLSSVGGVTLNPDLEDNISLKDGVKLLFNSTIRENASLFMFSAAREDEMSYDGSLSGNSEMTGYLLSAMGGGRAKTSLGTIAAMKNNRLTLMNIVKYVYDGMENNSAHSNIPLTNGRNDDLVLFQF